MEIGGQDITINHHSEDPFSIVMRVIYLHWPYAVTKHYSDELFIYQDRDAEDSWNQFGLTDENGDQVIFLTFDEYQIHCVIQEGDSKTLKIINEITEALKHDRV